MAAGKTYAVIATKTITDNSTTTYIFSPIPGTYDDLVLWMSVRNYQNNAGGYEIRLNGLGTGDSQDWLRNSNGSSLVTSGASNMGDFFHWPISNDTASVFTTNTLYISNYAQTSLGKAMIGRNGGRYYYGATGNSQQGINVGSQDTTNAITSIGVGYGDAFASGSVLTLYGIKRA